MSIIVAAKTGDRVLMMADSAESGEEELSTIYDDERLKILAIGDVLIGSAGRVRCIRRLVSHPEWFDTQGAPFDKRFIVTELIPKFWDELNQYNFLKYEEDVPPKSNALFLIAHQDRLFRIGTDFSVFEIDKYAAVGCTRHLISPMLNAMEEGKELETLLSAVRLSGNLSPSVGPPYYYIDTKDMKYTMIKE